MASAELLMAPAPPGASGAPREAGLYPQVMPASGWRNASAQDWLDCWSGLDRRARMVVTAERIYVAGDRQAEQSLAARRDLRLHARRIETVDPSGKSSLETLLRVDDGEMRTVCVARRHSGGHLLMRAGRLSSPGGIALIGVSFWVADGKFVVEWPDFRPIFGLTTAEATVVEQLIQGIGAEAIAAALQVSINTVRTHISHVYEKLGISCREQLWRRLAPYRIN